MITLPTTSLEKRAAAAFERLQALDEHIHEREELLCAGVSAHSVDELYPKTYPGLVRQLVGHLRRQPLHVDLGRVSYALTQTMDGIHVLWKDLRPEVRREWRSATDAVLDLPETRELKSLVAKQLGESPLAKAAAANFSGVLWPTWWLMSHRALLSATQQKSADSLMLRLHEFIPDVGSPLAQRTPKPEGTEL